MSRKSRRSKERETKPRGISISSNLIRRIFSGRLIAWICVGIVACGFILQRIGANNVPPSNQKGHNLYMREGGYYYDEFLSPIILYVQNDRVPEKFDAWEASHPPLFTLLGGGFVHFLESFGHITTAEAFQHLLWVPGLIYILFAVSCFWFFRQALAGLAYDIPKFLLPLVFGILVFNPCIFIQSLDFSNDLLVNMLIVLTVSASIWYWRTCRSDKFNFRTLAIGLFLGLAAYTKHTGLGFAPMVAMFLGFVTFTWLFPQIFHRASMPGSKELANALPAGAIRWHPVALRCLEGGAALLLAFLLVQGEYRDNYKKYKTLTPSHNEKEIKAFRQPAVAKQRIRDWNYGFSPGLFVEYSYTPKFDKPLWEQPVYKEIFISMPALFWDDLGFYSKEGVSAYYYYSPKKTPPLVRILPFFLAWVLLVPFVWGLWRDFRYPALISIVAVLSMAFFAFAWYLRLVASADSVGVKAKYILCLLPLFLGVALRGLANITDRRHAESRILAPAVGVYLTVLLVCCFIYDCFFALT